MGKYTNQRKKYYDIAIARYSEGMTAKEITKIIPVSKSTIYRWVEEHFGAEETSAPSEIVIPRTPASVARTIKAMASRILELEKQVEQLKKQESISDSSDKYEKAVKSILAILRTSELI